MIIVTGGAGFIGSAFISKLNSEGIDDILVVDNLGDSNKWMNLRGKRYANYMNKEQFHALISNGSFPTKPEAVVHLGACSTTTVTDAEYMMQNNFCYTKVLAEWCLDNDVRLVYASSGATYGDRTENFSDKDEVTPTLVPLNVYGYSKHAFDLWALQTGASTSIAGLKFFNVYGPNEYHKGAMASVVFKSFGHIKQHGYINLFESKHPDYKDGEQKRDFIYVKDCCDIMWWLLQERSVAGIFNVGTGKARSWNDLAKAVYSAISKDPDIRYIPMPEELVNKYQYFTQAEMEKLFAAGCPITISSLEDGVRDYIQNYLEQPVPHL